MGQDEEHARHRTDLREVADNKAGVSVGRARHDAVDRALRPNVVRVAAAACEEPWILDPRRGLADTELHGAHRDLLVRRSVSNARAPASMRRSRRLDRRRRDPRAGLPATNLSTIERITT
jgi:hypothetical protein